MSMENKKNGFWSWLGLGKKKEQQEVKLTEESSVQELVKPVEVDINKSVSASTETEQLENNIASIDEVSSLEKEHITIEKRDLVEDSIGTVTQNIVQSVVSDEDIASFEQTPIFDSASELVEQEVVEQVTTYDNDLHVEIVEEIAVQTASTVTEQEKPSEGGFFSRLVKGLLKTKQNIGVGFRSLFLGKKIDDELFEELEEQLLVADLGVPTTTKIIYNLTQHASRKQLQDAELLYQQLKVEMAEILKPVTQPLIIDQSKKPYVILMVGVNGVGKTTTIGKLARKFQQEGKSVMLAAGDTFRAAAVEQLQVWGERNHIPVVAQSTGSDSASVIFDAMQSAAARNIDVLIADTAGRLQNKNNLMDELKKIVRVMKKYDETAPHEIMLTLDAGTGQNAISQAKLFHEAVGLTGISLTKLDGTAKGGVIFAIADQFNLPIRYIGVGEKIEDLREFNADEFIEALFVHED
ncbi:signal recognition particle-docking protein FtsY [Pasteurella canis]|uniref:signal recognition particle-docking protein FtsY n=1 Tax=Pasteurella canis TaxID=753 RepID=UPI001E34B304|nr:signal recognition particle-docking protein FtsY [Pasteurella canis]